MTYLLQHYLDRSAQKFPNRPFVKRLDRQHAYGEFDLLTNRLADLLAACGARRYERVCFYMPRSADAFVAAFGILKSDGIYVAVNPRTPDERVRLILRECGCRVVIANADSLSGLLRVLDGFEGEVTVVLLGAAKPPGEGPRRRKILDQADVDRACAQPRDFRNIDLDPAYILFTSGSTGTPKGVTISHRNVIDYADWAGDFFDLRPEDRIANTSGLFFDLSVFETYAGVRNGASIHVIPDERLVFPKLIVDLVDAERLTVWNSVPSLMTAIGKVGVLKSGRCESLRTIVFCGEVMPTQTVMDWMRALPNRLYVNLYGPAETTCESMYYVIKEAPADPEVPIPIGRACGNTEVFALKDDLTLAGTGEEGELHIRGSSNGLGYWNDPEKTARAFRPDPTRPFLPDRVYATGDIVRQRPDGDYDFVGRRDFQIKHMGYRIELGEIEAALNALDCIVESAAVAIDAKTVGSKEIVAFVVLKRATETADILAAMGRQIPSYMLPRRIVAMDSLPKNLHGKIDRVGLAATLDAESA